MALQQKNDRDYNSSKLKRNKEVIFLMTVIAIALSIVMVNYLLLDKKYLRVKLYIYNNKNGQFDFESRKILKSNSSEERVKDVLNELISGPVGENHERLFSPETIIQFVAISKRDVVYISFDWSIVKSLRENPSKIIDSIVTSIKRNIRNIKGVKILIDGVESINTFNGIKLNKTFMVK